MLARPGVGAAAARRREGHGAGGKHDAGVGKAGGVEDFRGKRARSSVQKAIRIPEGIGFWPVNDGLRRMNSTTKKGLARQTFPPPEVSWQPPFCLVPVVATLDVWMCCAIHHERAVRVGPGAEFRATWKLEIPAHQARNPESAQRQVPPIAEPAQCRARPELNPAERQAPPPSAKSRPAPKSPPAKSRPAPSPAQHHVHPSAKSGPAPSPAQRQVPLSAKSH